MNRRQFLKQAAAIPALTMSTPPEPTRTQGPAHRARPGEASWPSEAAWRRLKYEVGGRLIALRSPLAACRENPEGTECREFFHALRNPYYVRDDPALTQTSGWVGAWTSSPSAYAVEAESAADVVAAVNFARRHNLRLVVKGGGHSYQGTSCAPDSLLIWTRRLNRVTVEDAFIPSGAGADAHPQPAVTAGAGAIWMQVYEAVTTGAGRYVQGGGCTTVGVAGLIQSGGFGSFSKRYGLAAAGLLEAEVVTADGEVRIASAHHHPDLFWALKGGGGGTFGAVTRLTLRTRELPSYFGGVAGTVRATSDNAYRKLVQEILRFYREDLFNPHWGEQIAFGPGRTVQLSMVFQGLDARQAHEVWKPFRDWVVGAPDDFTWTAPFICLAAPARNLWDARFLRSFGRQLIVGDDRPGAPEGNVFWISDAGQVGWVIHGYRSAWLPAALLQEDREGKLVEALIASSRIWPVALHFNKGLAGAPEEERAAARDAAIHPAAADAFALAILAGGGPPAFPGIASHEPDTGAARRDSSAIHAAMAELRKVTGRTGSYVSESDYFERDWRRSFWGPHYERLAHVKRKYDPDGLFIVHHGVGSEEWSADGFTRVKG